MYEMDAKLPRAYWQVWWASVINNSGDGVWNAALPLLAASLSRDPRLVAAVSVAIFLPLLVFSLPAGVIVDRYDRATLISRAQFAQFGLVATTALLVAAGLASIPILCVLGFLVGCADTLVTNAAQAVIPELVGAHQLQAANARQQISQTVTTFFIGPPIGSLLFAVAAGLPLAVDSVTFALSAVLLATLPRGQSEAPVAARPSWRDAASGLQWLRGQRLLRTLALLVGLNNFCNLFAQATFVLLAIEHFGMPQRDYGFLLATMALGGVLGGLVNTRLTNRFGWLPAMLTALSVNAVAYLAIGLAPNVVVLGGLICISGFATTLWNVASLSLRQLLIPRSIFGRVNSVFRMVSWGLMPAGAAAGGFVAHWLGVVAPFPIAGALRTVGLLLSLYPLLSSYRGLIVTGSLPQVTRAARPQPAQK